MPATETGTITGVDTVVITNLNNSPIPDNVAVIEVGSGTFTSVTATFQGSANGTDYVNLAAVRLDTLAIEQTPTVTNSTSRQWKCDVSGMQKFRMDISACTSTAGMPVQINTFYQEGGIAVQLAAALSGNQAISGTLTVTSASATALTVGRQGATDPGLTIDASTSVCATGLKITPAAAAAGVALVVTSSGTNEALTIDAKGSGTISINATATGAVILPTTNITDAKNVVLATTTGKKKVRTFEDAAATEVVE